MRALALLAVVAVVVALPAAASGASPAAGKAVWNASGCGACHTFKPAGSKGKVGPALTKAVLAADAKRAKQKSLAAFIRTSIVKPDAYLAKGYKGGMPPFTKLRKKQLDDLVAFIQKG